jgi:hypothetical protein
VAGGRKKIFGSMIFVGIGGALCVLGWQALTWLMTSVWKPISVLTALNWLHMRWSVFPDSGSGLHQLLGTTPLAVALLGLGVLGFLAFVVFD